MSNTIETDIEILENFDRATSEMIDLIQRKEAGRRHHGLSEKVGDEDPIRTLIRISLRAIDRADRIRHHDCFSVPNLDHPGHCVVCGGKIPK